MVKPLLLAFMAAATQTSMAAVLQTSINFTDVTKTNLPTGLIGRCMDAAAHDFDKDGDIDLMLAMEFAPNILLTNNGKGVFTRTKALPNNRHDSEDIAVADFNKDGWLDAFIVSEDDKVNELYLNRGDGTFADASSRIKFTGESNAVVTADLNGDGANDIIIGNVGPLGVLINNGKGYFKDESKQRGPNESYRVQDLTLIDVDGDGDLDLLTGDEVRNHLFINDGKGFFKDETAKRLPKYHDVTREVISADVDNDGDNDIYYANIASNPQNAKNRLLLNNGKGYFTEVTNSHLLTNPGQDNFTARFVDLNNDKAIALLVPSSTINGTNNGRYRAYINTGDGHFSEAQLSPPWPPGNGFDISAADFNGDGKTDFYLCNRARRRLTPDNGGVDALMFGR